jgi:hypothetical protein
MCLNEHAKKKKNHLNKIFYILLFFSYQLFGQTERIMTFYPLSAIDTISDLKVVEKLQRVDSLNSENYFFANEYNEVEGFYFIKRNRQIWIVFDFEDTLTFGPNTSVSKIKRESDNFISIQTYRSPSGGCSNIYGFLFLLNIQDCKRVDFSNYNLEECYDGNGEVSYGRECKADFEITNGFVKIESTKKPDDGMYCIESSEYKIEASRLIKTKYYSELAQRLFPVVCIDNICTGMAVNAMKKEFPKATFEKAPLFKYGYDSQDLGIEVCIDGKVLFFVAVPNEIITGISIVSPLYSFNGISTETTFAQMLEKYPDYKLHIDLISDWEFVYLKDERIRLNFKTDNTNRIGIYDSDPEDAAKGIKRKDAKIDFIQTF